MGKAYPEIDDEVRRFIEKQRVFFVASAPLSGEGHINLSPKGLDTFRILDSKTVAYLDFYGSGIETVAHLKENGRIVLMFCAFQGAPNILRLHGRGRVVLPQDAEFGGLMDQFSRHESVRAIDARSVVVVEVTRVSDSCGFGVPLFKYEAERNQLAAWAKKRGPEGLKEYRRSKNRVSVDGLPGLAE
jgi:hypothetical protein